MRSFLLLLPLPVIAGWIAYSGLTYVPVDLKLDLSERPATLIRLPESVARFKMTGNVRAFNRDNLYEYVNGHAEFFLSSGFVSLTVAYYSPGKGEVTVELYDMENGENALGVLKMEKGNAKPVDTLGFEAYSHKRAFVFSKGRYYVRFGLFGDTEEESVLRLASELAGKIKEDTAIPERGYLPLAERVEKSERFVKTDYMGLSFFSSIRTARYLLGGAEFEAFEWKMPPDRLLDFFKSEKAKIESRNFGGLKGFVIEDRYEGRIHIVTNGQVSIGLKGELPEKELSGFMQEAVASLKEPNG